MITQPFCKNFIINGRWEAYFSVTKLAQIFCTLYQTGGLHLPTSAHAGLFITVSLSSMVPFALHSCVGSINLCVLLLKEKLK